LRDNHFRTHEGRASFPIGEERRISAHYLSPIKICKNNFPGSLLEEYFSKSKVADNNTVFMAMMDGRKNGVKQGLGIFFTKSLLRACGCVEILAKGWKNNSTHILPRCNTNGLKDVWVWMGSKNFVNMTLKLKELGHLIIGDQFPAIRLIPLLHFN